MDFDAFQCDRVTNVRPGPLDRAATSRLGEGFVRAAYSLLPLLFGRAIYGFQSKMVDLVCPRQDSFRTYFEAQSAAS